MKDFGTVIIDENGKFETVYINQAHSSITVYVDFDKGDTLGYVNVKIKDCGRTTKERIDIITKRVYQYMKTQPRFHVTLGDVLYYDATEKLQGYTTKKPTTKKTTTHKSTVRKTVRK